MIARIARIAREDPAAGSRSDGADVMLARLRHEIGAGDPSPAHARRIGQVAVPAAAALVAVAVAAIGLLAHRSRLSGSAARTTRPVSAVAVGSVRLAPGTEVLLAHEGALWIAGVHSLQRLDPRSGAVTATVRLPVQGLATGVAFGAGSAWVASGGATPGELPHW